MEQEQEKCKRCKGLKFDQPKKKCTEPDFHWLMAGREWQLNDEERWVAVETRQARASSYDGLLVHADLKKEAQEVGTVTLGQITMTATIVDGKVTLTKSTET